MDNDKLLENYDKLYTQYKELFIKMINKDNLKSATLLELSILLKMKYKNKAKAITRAINLFYQKGNENSLEELIDLYNFIKE